MSVSTVFRTFLFAAFSVGALASGAPVSVCHHAGTGSFALISQGRPAAIFTDPAADPAVQHAAAGFADDLRRVSGLAPRRFHRLRDGKGPVVIIGVLGQSPVIRALTRAGKIRTDDIAGQWEAYRQAVVSHPFPGIPQALVIVGSDRRGAVFGTYDISEKIGVSPFYWFADVPVRKQADVFLTSGSRRDQPGVRYRGFFINDEAPAFSGWAQKKFGGANSRLYAHVFELLLRMKGNYLWPAMWPPRAFAADDPRNMTLADEMGVVMGTSHHEPMMRAHDEWHRNPGGGFTGGKWDYRTNGASLRAFWRGGIRRMMSGGHGRAYESVVTIGMRGDGDEPMAEGRAIDLLETVISDQRKIIADVTGKPASRTPQVWALYKEVQDYYDHGMKVPDDVTLLFSDDNWGQIRRLPASAKPHKGGYGIYYHFDYVGAPRNYKWLNTNQIEKVWQQMNLAYETGAKKLWIVNVGDIKPMAYPLAFFMRMAWHPDAMTPAALAAYPAAWARASFGPQQAEAIAALITRYSRLAARRKPELVDADSFRLGPVSGDLDGGEFGGMAAAWRDLEADMRTVRAALTPTQQDAFYELVAHPILAMSNLYQLYYAVAWNRRLAASDDPRANVFADEAEAAFRRDRDLTAAYHALRGGKWDGMMSQPHIGYTSWQEPKTDVMPAVRRVKGAAAIPVRFAARRAPSPDVIAIEAPHFSRAYGGRGLSWQVIPHLGRTLGAVLALPQGQPPTTGKDGVRLEYDVAVKKSGTLHVRLYLAPTLDTRGTDGNRVGVSVDDRPMHVLTENLVPAPQGAKSAAQRAWETAVIDNVYVAETSFADVTAGTHVVKVWRLDDNVVLQKLVAGTQALPSSYLGPPETPKGGTGTERQ